MEERLLLLQWLKRRARTGINNFRIKRKYVPKGNYTACEIEALQALLEIEQVIDNAIKDNETTTESMGAPL